MSGNNKINDSISCSRNIYSIRRSSSSSSSLHQNRLPSRLRKCNFGLPGLKTTSFFTILMLVCLETVLLSTVSNCAKTFYMHWNTSNSIFRIDNTDHIIDVNKGNSAFEFDQVHIICPVYEPGTYENETEKYIIYNVSKVEYETCRITNADPRVIAICDKPQKLMFFTITFRPFTPQPGGLEFLPGNDYYFISTSSKDDLYRRIGGRCSTNNMKVVFKVCCAPEQKNTTIGGSSSSSSINDRNGHGGSNNNNNNNNNGNSQQHHNNNINMQNNINNNNGQNNGQSVTGSSSSGTSINTNIDQFNRISVNGNNNNNNGHQTGIRINNISQNRQNIGNGHINQQGSFIPPLTNINTNNSNVVQSTMSWPGWGNNNGINGIHPQHSTPVTTIGLQPHFYPPYMTSSRPNINSAINNSNYSPSHKPTKKTNEYDKHPNEVVKNEELTYNSGASSILSNSRRHNSQNIKSIITTLSYNLNSIFTINNNNKLNKLLLLILIIFNSNLFNFINFNFFNINNNNNISLGLFYPILILIIILVILSNIILQFNPDYLSIYYKYLINNNNNNNNNNWWSTLLRSLSILLSTITSSLSSLLSILLLICQR